MRSHASDQSREALTHWALTTELHASQLADLLAARYKMIQKIYIFSVAIKVIQKNYFCCISFTMDSSSRKVALLILKSSMVKLKKDRKSRKGTNLYKEVLINYIISRVRQAINSALCFIPRRNLFLVSYDK